MFLTIAFRLRLSVVVVGVTSRTSAVDDHSLRLRRIEEYERNMNEIYCIHQDIQDQVATVVHISHCLLMSWLAVCTLVFLWKRF